MDDYNPRTRYEHYYVRMARLEGRGELQKRYPDDFYVRPFQIAGNVYYIGNNAVCTRPKTESSDIVSSNGCDF